MTARQTTRQFVVSAAFCVTRYIVAPTLTLMLALNVGHVSAAVIVDGQGFEAPFFDTTFAGTGQLEGQTPATFNGTWLRTKGVGLSTADVQTAVDNGGLQAVRVDRVANSDDRWAVPVSGYPSIGQRYICIDWDMRVEQTTGAANTFGPFFGVEAYDDDAATIGLLGSLGVDATTGDVLYQAEDTGFFTETGALVTFGQWNNFHIQLDFLLHEVMVALNGSVIATTGFVDHNNIPGGLNEFTDADISAIAAAGDAASQALGGTAYFDNFVVVESMLPCIPEPTSLALAVLGFGAVAGTGRSRRAGRKVAPAAVGTAYIDNFTVMEAPA
jgi:hypothetical protein